MIIKCKKVKKSAKRKLAYQITTMPVRPKKCGVKIDKLLLCLNRMQKACLIFVSVVKCGVHHSDQAVTLTVQIEP